MAVGKQRAARSIVVSQAILIFSPLDEDGVAEFIRCGQWNTASERTDRDVEEIEYSPEWIKRTLKLGD